MSEATIFEFPYNLFIKQRLEFVVICHDQIAAAIMRIVECEMIKQKEAWQNKVTAAVEAKKTPPKEPAEYWVRLSHGQIIAKLYYYDSGKLEKPGEEATEEEIKEYLAKKGIALSKTTIRRTVNLLIDLGFLLMRSKPGDEFGAPLYTLQRKNVQKALKSLPANPFSIFNQWEGVSNLEGGVSNLETRELAESEGGVSNLESGEFPKTKVNKDNKEISSKTSRDNLLKEGTSASSVDDDATPSSSFANGEDDGTNNANTASLQSDHHSSVNGVTVRVDVRHSEEVNGQSTSTENEENNRLTSTPESPSQQNVSTDESSLRIASETANETPSSPVIEPATDEMIHADARKDGDSYSPQSTAKTPTPTTEQTEATETPVASGKGSGKRSGGKKSAEKPYQTKKEDPLKDRMEQVYQHFEEIGREMFVDPEFHVDRAWSPRTELYKAIVTLLDERGSAEGMHLVFMDMWNEVSSDGTTYWWREPKHLTLRALCKNYSTRLASIRFKARQATDNNQKLPRPSVSGMRNYTFEKGDPTPPPSALPYNITPQSSPEPLVKPGEQQSTRKRLYMKRPVRNIS